MIEEGSYAYLEEDITSQQYEVQIGEETSIELGKYNGNGTTVNSLKIFYFIEGIKYG